LPYELEGQKASNEYTAHVKENAERWAGLGDAKNYKRTQYDEQRIAITYEPPKPLTDDEKKRLAESTTSLTGFNIVGWAMKSLEINKVADGLTLEKAVAHAKSIDHPTAFDMLNENASSAQVVMASVASCVICFADPQSADAKWAWDVVAKVEAMNEPPVHFSGSIIPWHPKTRLVVALRHDRRSATPRANSAARLVKLALHPLDSVSHLAIYALFGDKDEQVRWVAGQLAVNLCIVHRREFKDGGWDHAPNDKARADSLAAALAALKSAAVGPMPKLPPAWVQGGKGRRRNVPDELWQLPAVSFDSQTAAKLFANMPLEAWMATDVHRAQLEPCSSTS
jgi:hypothetical protein